MIMLIQKDMKKKRHEKPVRRSTGKMLCKEHGLIQHMVVSFFWKRQKA